VARDILPEELRRAGALVDVVEAYRTVRPKGQEEKVYELLAKRAISALTFTSSSTVSNFVKMVGRKDARELTAGIPVASIGPITAAKVRSLGMETTIMPQEYTIPALIDALVKYFTAEAAATKKKPKSKNQDTTK
jgi:uroporphyrinogen III methyltransferase/synthase